MASCILISTLDLSRIEATGFTPADSMQRLEDYVSALLQEAGDRG